MQKIFKRNRFKQKNGNLILYPDYGNVKGFLIIGIFCLLFCYALYAVDAQHHNIGATNIFYIITSTLLFLLIGFASGYKKVIFDNQNQIVKVLFWGIHLKEIPFTEIKAVEERSGSLPSAFYIILKSNHIGSSVRLSVTYNQRQLDSKTEFYHQVLPIIRGYLSNTDNTQITAEKVAFRRFKKIAPYVYQYIPIQKIVFSLISLSFSIFFFALVYVFIPAPLTIKTVLLLIFLFIGGLFFLIPAFINFSITKVDTQTNKIIQKSLLGFSLVELSFNQIEKILVRDTSLNGLVIYTSIIIAAQDTTLTIDKSIFSQLLSDLDREIGVLLREPTEVE